MPRANRCGYLKQTVKYMQLEELVDCVARELGLPVQNGSMVTDYAMGLLNGWWQCLKSLELDPCTR